MKITKIETTEVKFSTINKVSSKNIVSMAAIHQHPLYLCNQKIFSFEPFAQTEWLHSEIDKGIHHFFSLTYTEDDFIEEIETISHESTGTVVPIVNLGENTFWQEVFKLVLEE